MSTLRNRCRSLNAAVWLVTIAACNSTLLAEDSNYVPVPNQAPSRLDVTSIDAQTSTGVRVRATLWWEPGVPVNTSGEEWTGGSPCGFRLLVQRIDGDGESLTAGSALVTIPHGMASRSTYEATISTGAMSWDAESDRLLIVVGDVSGANIGASCADYALEVTSEGACRLVGKSDRISSLQSVSFVVPIPNDMRPLLTSVEDGSNGITLGIALWNPTTARPTSPTPTVRARISPDFKQVIAVEEIPAEPPPADPPPADPE